MQGSAVVSARFSQAIYHSKRSFERQLDSIPSTAFHYYYQTKIKELQARCSSVSSGNVSGYAQQNNGFKRYIKKEWELLSSTKKRLYYAFFFHFTNIDYRTLNKYELARIMGIPTPATSGYMLFRYKFKNKFDTAWQEESTTNKRKRNAMLRRGNMFSNQVITVMRNNSNTRLAQLSRVEKQADITNLTERFRDMCRECRHVWSKQVSEERKHQIEIKWEEQKKEFENKLRYELEILEYNLKRLMQTETRHNLLCIDRPVTNTTLAHPTVIFPFAPNKKK